MGNRSRYVAAAAVGGGALLARRRLRMRKAAEGIRDTILPTHVQDLPTDPRPREDEAHAPGHRHLAPAKADREPPRLRGLPSERPQFGRQDR